MSRTASAAVTTLSLTAAAESDSAGTRMFVPPRAERLAERADAGDVSADEEGLDRLGALESVDGLDVHHVPDHVEVEQDAIAAEQVPGVGEHLPGHARVVQLRQPGEGGGKLAGGIQFGDLNTVQLHRGDVGEHPHQPLLDD